MLPPTQMVTTRISDGPQFLIIKTAHLADISIALMINLKRAAL
jgi:hypothetical protein